MLAILILTMKIIFYLVSGRYPIVTKVGDALMIDSGEQLSSEWYTLDFGNIEISEEREYKFTLKELPVNWFSLGFLVSRKDGSAIMKNTKVEIPKELFQAHIKVTNSKNEIVIDETGQTSNWLWYTYANTPKQSFVYKRTQEAMFWPYDRYKKSLLTDELKYGTSFLSDKELTYQIVVLIRDNAKISEEFVAKFWGIGWGSKGF